MRVSRKLWVGVGASLTVALLLLVGVRAWVVPNLITGKLEAELGGRVTIRDWWLNGRSSGVVGLTLHEGKEANSPAWARVERVETDLSLGGVLSGRVLPRRVAMKGADLQFRLNRDGQFVNLPALHGPKRGATPPTRLPAVSIDGARATFRREGRGADMVVAGVSGRLVPGGPGEPLRIEGGADDRNWGHWSATGSIEADKGRGSLRLKGARVQSDPTTLARVAFVPDEVWTHVTPRGPVDVDVRLDWETGDKATVRTRTEVHLLGDEAAFPTLGLSSSGTKGTLRIENGVVRAEGIEGEAIGGRVAAAGALDFGRSPPTVDLGLDLKRVDIQKTPKSWQLDEAGITGRLTGKVRLLARLAPNSIDLTGSTGDAVVEKGSIQGIPFKSLRLAMQADGNDLQYNTKTPAAALDAIPEPMAGKTAARTSAFWSIWGAPAWIALQALPADAKGGVRKGGVQLPKSLSTHLELEDVDVAQLVARAQFLVGFPFPIPITGKLSLKADATIPLGALREIKGYAFHGDLTLTGASIYKVDVGQVSTRLDLERGVLVLKDFRGQLVDRPNGGPDNPPPKVRPTVPAAGPIPPGGFRGDLRAELDPPGRLSARFEGNQLPLGELAAPVLPRPTPLAGLATLQVEADSDLRAASDPGAWAATGHMESEHITYRGAALDSVAFAFDLKAGHLDVSRFAARLAGNPLSAKVGIDLKPPYAYRGTVDVAAWDLAAVEGLIPNAPHPSPIGGAITAHARADGTLSPRRIETDGRGRIARFQAGPVPLGDVPFGWKTVGETIVVSGVEARPFGGRFEAEARVPTVAGPPTLGSATIRGIDTALITAAMPGEGLKLTGKADGKVSFRIPGVAHDVEATVTLSAPDLTIQGIPTEHLAATLRARSGALNYEVTADSLGGKVKFLGDFPLTQVPGLTPLAPGAKPVGRAADGEIRAVGFTLEEIWKAVGLTGALTQLTGRGAVDANVRDVFQGAGKGVWAHGVVELRDLSWGVFEPLGHFRGILVKTPAGWRVEPMNGEIAGGAASGFLWGDSPATAAPVAGAVATASPHRLGFSMRIDRAPLKRVVGFLPTLARGIDGLGTLRVTGDLGEGFRGNAELLVPQATVAGLPVSELRGPAELTLTPSTGDGTLHVRHLSARVAGGLVEGDATVHLGEDRSFEATARLSGIDLLSLARLATDSTRPPSGRLRGRILVRGPNPADPGRYKGRITLDLDDASLVEVPVFRGIDRFLGSAGGGLFEDGDLVATIANKQFLVEMLTLQGRLVQLHATGSVGFDTQVNLEVLVNTNQIIPETGQALARLIPGLGSALGRDDRASLEVANYLSNRLLKLRVTGTLKNPSVVNDSSIGVAGPAVAFFAGVLKLPLALLK